MKKRILFIKKCYSPFGGAELYLSRVISILEHKFDIHIISENWPLSSKTNVHLVPRSKIFPDLSFALHVLYFLKKKKDYFDLVVSFDRCLKQDIYRSSDGCHLRWLEQRKLFETRPKHLSLRINPKHKIISWLEKKCLRNSAKILVNSKMVLNDYSRHYGQEISHKIEICYNGVNLKNFFPISSADKKKLKKRYGFSKKEILLFIGSGYKRKGLDYLLKSMPLLSDNFILLVIGKDKNLINIKKQTLNINKLANRVYFLGPQKNILSYYQIADIFILPTLYDPFANVTLEALACGVPVITSIFNGASEIIDKGKEGFILNDIKYFTTDIKKFVRIINFQSDFFSKNAIEKANKFCLSSRIKDFLRQIELC